MPLRYHSQAAKLLRRTVSKRSTRDLDVVGKHFGVRIPAAFREWFAYQSMTNSLHHNDSDFFLRVGQLRLSGFKGTPVLIFMAENQGCCWWGLLLDGSSDPPVYVLADDALPSKWMTYMSHFSQFVHMLVFDSQYMAKGITESAIQSKNLSTTDKRFLREHLHHEDLDTPLPTVLRFSNGWGQRLIVRDRGLANARGSTWTVACATKADLKEIKELIEPLAPTKQWAS